MQRLSTDDKSCRYASKEELRNDRNVTNHKMGRAWQLTRINYGTVHINFIFQITIIIIAQNYSISVALNSENKSEATTVHPKTIDLQCKYDYVTDIVTQLTKPYILKKRKAPDQITRLIWDFMFLNN